MAVEPSNSARQLREPAWAGFSQLITSGGNFLTTVILVRTLGLAEFGQFSVAFLVMMLARNFLIAMVLTPMSAIGPKLRATSLPAYRGFLLAQAALFAAGLSIALVAAFFAAAQITGLFWLTDLAVPLAVANFLGMMADFFQRNLFVEQRSGRAASLDLVRFGLQLAVLVYVAIAMPDWLSGQGALLILAGAAFCAAVLGGLFYPRVSWRPSLNRAAIGRHWKFARAMGGATLFESIEGPLALLAVSTLLSTSAFGALRAIQALANALLLPVTAAQRIAVARGARTLASAGALKMRRFEMQLAGTLVCSSVFLGFAVWLARDWILDLLKVEQTPGILLALLLFLAGNVAGCLRFTYNSLHQIAEDVRPVVRTLAVSALVTLALVLTLTADVGVAAFPGIRLLVYIVGAVALLVSWRRLSAAYPSGETGKDA